MEVFDVYDENRNKTGKVKRRFIDELETGEYALIVGSLIINPEGKLLIGKRSEFKPAYAGLWEFIGGGSRAGESSKQAIIREIEEEVGIRFNVDDAVFVKTANTDHLIKDMWAFKSNIDINELHIDKNEITEVKWESIDNIIELREQEKMIDSTKVTKEDVDRCIKELN